MSGGRRVIVKQLPKRFAKDEVEQFSRELRPLLRAERPRLVLDFSRVRELDRLAADALLHYIEEALKEGGDIKLASLPSAPAVILELTGTDRFFEIHPRVTDAVKSFDQLPGEFSETDQPWPVAAYAADGMENELRMAS